MYILEKNFTTVGKDHRDKQCPLREVYFFFHATREKNLNGKVIKRSILCTKGEIRDFIDEY